jgi:hypothetical protein
MINKKQNLRRSFTAPCWSFTWLAAVAVFSTPGGGGFDANPQILGDSSQRGFFPNRSEP